MIIESSNLDSLAGVSNRLSGVFWYLDPILESFAVHACHHVWSGVFGSARPADDSASVCGGLRGDIGCGLVRRPFQQVSIHSSV